MGLDPRHRFLRMEADECVVGSTVAMGEGRTAEAITRLQLRVRGLLSTPVHGGG